MIYRILFFLVGFLIIIGSIFATISVLSHTRSADHPLGKNSATFLDDSLSRQPFTFLEELHDAKISDTNVYKNEDPIVGSIVQLLSESTSRMKRIKTDTTIGIAFPVRELTIWDKARIQALKEELASNPSLKRQKEIQEELNKIHLETNSRAGIDRMTPIR